MKLVLVILLVMALISQFGKLNQPFFMYI